MRVTCSGTSLSPANRSVANTLVGTRCSVLVMDVANLVAMGIGHAAVVVYRDSVRGAKVAACLDLVQRGPEPPSLDPERLTDIFGGVSRLIPDDAGHGSSGCFR